MEKFFSFILILFMFYITLFRPIKKWLIPFIRNNTPKGINYFDVLYLLIILICLLFVPYKDIKGHSLHFIINNRSDNMDYFFLFYELLIITVLYGLLKLIKKKKKNQTKED